MSERSISLSPEEWERAKRTADERMKAANGHVFETILKTRCIYCRRSPRAKGKCGAWFQSFLWHLDVILWNLDQERARWATLDEPAPSTLRREEPQ